MRNLFAVIDKASGNAAFNSVCTAEYDTDALHIDIFGRIQTSGDKVNNFDEIARLYGEHGINMTEVIHGSYIAVFYDKATMVLDVIQDCVTSPVALYYTEDPEKIYIGTSIKRIYSQCKAKRELNGDVVPDFVMNGFINGRETLIKGLSKLCYGDALTVENGKITLKSVCYPLAEMTETEGLEKFDDILSSAVWRCAYDGDMNIALSSGYDSNYILYALRKFSDGEINAFSIGGTSGNNELPYAEAIAKLYDKVNLRTAMVGESSLENFPDIVWRLEGAVNEEGVYLQYALTKTISGCGIKSLICGEVADQVFNKNYYSGQRRELIGLRGKAYTSKFFPYEYGVSIILKKSGIMANSFGIDTRYPFVDDRVISLGKATKEVNGTSKQYHKENCKIHLNPKVYEIINHLKIGGTTNFSALFADKKSLKAYYKFVENSEFSEMTYKSFVKSFKEITRLAGGKLLYHLKDNSYKVNDAYTKKKTTLYHNILYILVFKKLFISGEFDEKFMQDGIDSKLSEFMK